ncbi:MAG TPA: hypothetical protein VGR37_24825 [Longimicrobiaceae bacterium]|nr:hypothetical protein [Longimicrobiaceae bacterium]
MRNLTTELAEKAGIALEEAKQILNDVAVPEVLSEEDLLDVRGGNGTGAVL